MRHLNPFFFILFIFLTACKSGGDPEADGSLEQQQQDSAIVLVDTASEPVKVPNSIQEIQKAYEVINAQLNKGAFDSTSFKYNCSNEKRGEVSYFSINGQLRMIIHRFNEYDHHWAEDYYYVTDSVLFFVYNKRVSWAFDSGPEGSTMENFTEQRVYLVDQAPIKCLEKKYVIRSHVSNNPKPETVPNKEVDCSSIKAIFETFKTLEKHRYKDPGGCL